MKTINIYTLDDFKKYLIVGSSLNTNIVLDTTTIPINSCSYSSTYKAFRINTNSSLKGAIHVNLGRLVTGDKVSLDCEFMNVSGQKAQVFFDCYENNPLDNGLFISNVATKETFESNTFELTQLDFIAPRDGYYLAVIGITTAQVGDFYVRKIKFDIDSVINTDDEYIVVKNTSVIPMIGDGTNVNVTYNQIEKFGGADFATLSSGGRLQLKKGIYMFEFFAHFDQNATGVRNVELGGGIWRQPATALGSYFNQVVNIITIYRADSDNQTIHNVVNQNSGAALNLNAATVRIVKLNK